MDMLALTRQELALLHRIEAGEDLASVSNVDDQLAHNLAAQGMLRVTLAKACRSFALTEAGYTRLHGPVPHVSRSKRPRPTTHQARTLITQITDAGGTLNIHDPGDGERAGFLRLIQTARQRGLVPDGYRLLYTGRDHGDLILRLADRTSSRTEWNRIRLSARQHTSEPALITALLHEHRDWFSLDHHSHQRATLLIQHLCEQALRQGHQLILSTKSGRPRIWLQIGPHRRTITITTASAVARHVFPTGTRPAAYPPSLLAIVSTHDRWRHQAWAEDDRSLAAQAADVINQIAAHIERSNRIGMQMSGTRSTG